MIPEKKLPENFEAVPCNLCGSDRFRVKFDSPANAAEPMAQEDFLATVDRYDRYGRIVACAQCGLVYTNPRVKREVTLKGYQGSVDESYQKEDASRSINAYFSLSTIKKYIQSGRLLDVGCATGYFLNAARLEFDTFGVEPCAWGARYAQEKLKLHVVESTLKEASFPDGHFDAVSLIDTLEHLHDPRETIMEARRITRPGGYLYLVVPDIGSITARFLGGRWWGLRPAHLYYFSARTLTRMLEQCGYKVCLSRSFGKVFALSFWADRLKNYPKPLYKVVNGTVNALGVREKFFYLNTRDSLEIVARKI